MLKPGGVCFLRGDVALFDHQPQHDSLPLLGWARAVVGFPEVAVGIVVAGSLGQSGQQRGLSQCQIGCALAEVSLRCRLDAHGQVAVGDLVEV